MFITLSVKIQMENPNAVSKFAYSIFQSFLSDTVIYNFLNSYPKDQWNEIICCLLSNSIQTILSNYSKPPPIDKIRLISTSSYDLNANYILNEKLKDIRSKVLCIDKQLLELLGNDSSSTLQIRSSLEVEPQEFLHDIIRDDINSIERVTPQFNETCKGIRSSSSNRLQGSGIKHSMLIPRCQEISMSTTKVSNIPKNTCNMTQRSALKTNEENLTSNKKAQTRNGRFIHKRNEKEYDTEQTNENINNGNDNTQEQQNDYKSTNEFEKLKAKTNSLEKHKEFVNSFGRLHCLESGKIEDFINIKQTRSRDANALGLDNPMQRRTTDCIRDILKPILKSTNKNNNPS